MSDKKTEKLFEKALNATSSRQGPRFLKSSYDSRGEPIRVVVPRAKRFSAYVTGVANKSKTQHWFAYHTGNISHFDSGLLIGSWRPAKGSRFDEKEAQKAVEEINVRHPNLSDLLLRAERGEL